MHISPPQHFNFCFHTLNSSSLACASNSLLRSSPALLFLRPLVVDMLMSTGLRATAAAADSRAMPARGAIRRAIGLMPLPPLSL